MLIDLPIIRQVFVFASTFHIFPFPIIFDMILREPSPLAKKSVAVIYGLFLVLAYAMTSSWILSPFLAYAFMEVILRFLLSLTV